jgi:hypothetical protein
LPFKNQGNLLIAERQSADCLANRLRRTGLRLAAASWFVVVFQRFATAVMMVLNSLVNTATAQLHVL